MVQRTPGYFDYYQDKHDGANGDTIRADAADPKLKTQTIHALAKDLSKDGKKIATQMSGEITSDVQANAKTLHGHARKLAASGHYAVALLDKFAGMVDDFDTTTNECNVSYNSKLTGAKKKWKTKHPSGTDDAGNSFDLRAAVSAAAAPEKKKYSNAEDTLDKGAHTVAKMFHNPTNDNVMKLIDEGLLPLAAASLYPGVNPTAADKRAYANSVKAILSKMTTKQKIAWVTANKGYLDASAMAVIGESLKLTGPEGQVDARDLRTSADGDPSSALDKLSLLGLYAGWAQNHGVKLTDGQASYLKSFFNDLTGANGGGDATKKVLVALAGNHALTKDQRDADLKGLANGLLALSDSRLNHSLGYDAVPKAIIADLKDIPKLHTEYDSPNINYVPPTKTMTMEGGGGYRMLAGLLSHSTIQGGTQFSMDMTHETAQITSDLHNGLSGDSVLSEDTKGLHLGDWNSAMQSMVGTATRNTTADTLTLQQADADPDKAKDMLSLYTYDWPDDGKSVSGYTDWIKDYAAAHGQGAAAEHHLAAQASESLIDLVTQTPHGEGNHHANMFSQLMTGGMNAGSDDTKSYAQVNPDLARSFATVAGSNLEALGSHSNARWPDSHVDTDGMALTVPDRTRFFTLIGADPDASKALGLTIGTFEHHQLHQALTIDDPRARAEALTAAGSTASHLNGYASGGVMNAAMVTDHSRYHDDLSTYNQEMALINTGKSLALGGVGGDANTGLGLVVDGVINGTIKAPDVPSGHHVGAFSNQDTQESIAAYDFLVAAQDTHAHGVHVPDEVLDSHGHVLPLAEWGADTTDEVMNKMTSGHGGFAQYKTDYYAGGSFAAAAIDPKGIYSEQGVKDYLDGSID